MGGGLQGAQLIPSQQSNSNSDHQQDATHFTLNNRIIPTGIAAFSASARTAGMQPLKGPDTICCSLRSASVQGPRSVPWGTSSQDRARRALNN